MVVVLGLLLALFMGSARAIGRAPGDDRSSFDAAVMRVDESRYLGQPLGPNTEFLDEQGRRFALRDVLGKPVILVLSYFDCDGSCPTVNQNLVHGLEGVKRFALGRDYRVLTVSFDRHDTAQTAAAFLQKTKGLPAESRDAWRFAVLQGEGSDAPKAFANSLGVQFYWSHIDKMFVHPNVLVFLTPQGRVARYIYGTRMDAKTLELALIDADWGRISESASSAFDMITGACYSYNYADGRYQPNYALLAGVGSLILGTTLMGFGIFAYRRKLARRTVDAL